MKILVDGDILVYRAGFACENRHYVCHETERTFESKKEAKELGYPIELISSFEQVQVPLAEAVVHSCVRNMLRKMIVQTDTTSMDIILTASDLTKNFRYKIDNTYKGNRKSVKPVHYDLVRHILLSKYSADIVEGIEADDELGIRQTSDTIIASIDKDMWMIPGLHYDIGTSEIKRAEDPGAVSIVKSESGANKVVGHGFTWFCCQLLLGDSVDNIKGINGIGPVKAVKAFEKTTTCQQAYDVVEAIYKEKKEESRLNDTAHLLWIHRKEHQLWHPAIPRLLDEENV